MVQDDVLKKKVQILILQPFLQYVIELIFPYVIIICAVFGLMILMMVSILGLLVFRLQTPNIPVIPAAVTMAAGGSSM